MKNMDLAAIVLSFLLFGCSSSTAPQEHAQPISTLESSSEIAPEPELKSQEECNAEVASRMILAIKPEDLCSEKVYQQLKDSNIEAVVQNVKQQDKTRFSFELHLKAIGGAMLEAPIKALLSYNYGYSDENKLDFYKIEWGGISFVDANTIAISTLKELRFYDVATLKEKPPKLDLSHFAGKEYYLLGVARDDALGIVIPMALDGKDGFAYFNADGSFSKIEYFSIDGNSYFINQAYPMNVGNNPAEYQTNFKILNIDTPYLVFGDGYFYDAQKAALFGNSYPIFEWEDGQRRVQLHSFMGWFGRLAPVTGAKSTLALCYENNTLDSAFFFDGINMHRAFAEDNPDYESKMTYKWNPSSSTFMASCSFTDLTLSLNFSEKQADLEYHINPAHLGEAFEVSKNKRYSLHRSSMAGGGDIAFASIVLKDSKTARLKYLSQSGGMYGGYSHMGFLSDNEVYIQFLDSLRIFSTDTGIESPLLTFAMPLGELPESKITRYLLGFVRNPSGGYVVVFADSPFGSPYKDVADFNYIVGVCDEQGNLLHSYDTGSPMLTDNFGFIQINLQLAQNKLNITGGKGWIQVNGIFDLETHTYTDLRQQVK